MLKYHLINFYQKADFINKLDLVYFTTRLPDTRNTSATGSTRVRHECYTNDTSVTRVKNFDFDNGTSENILSQPYISYIGNERLQGKEEFHCKNYLSKIPRSHAKLFEKYTTKTELCNGKSYIKTLYTRLKLQMPLLVRT